VDHTTPLASIPGLALFFAVFHLNWVWLNGPFASKRSSRSVSPASVVVLLFFLGSLCKGLYLFPPRLAPRYTLSLFFSALSASLFASFFRAETSLNFLPPRSASFANKFRPPLSLSSASFQWTMGFLPGLAQTQLCGNYPNVLFAPRRIILEILFNSPCIFGPCCSW